MSVLRLSVSARLLWALQRPCLARVGKGGILSTVQEHLGSCGCAHRVRSGAAVAAAVNARLCAAAAFAVSQNLTQFVSAFL
jgi:hypothetical protein